MTKRTIEIEDTLDQHVEDAIESVTDYLYEYLDENPDTNTLPDISNALDYSGRIHEIIDGCVPIYTNEIKDTMYLYGDKIEQAFDAAGIGNKTDEDWPNGWHAAAIYCYIENAVYAWYRKNAQDVFDEWKEKHPQATP